LPITDCRLPIANFGNRFRLAGRVNTTPLLIIGALLMAAELPDFDKLWDYHDPAASEKRFRQLLSRAETSPDCSYHAQLLTQVARAQGLQRQFDGAHATLDRVEAMLAPGMHLPRARYLLERGRVFNSAKQPDRARPLFEQAFELACAHQLDAFAIDAAHMIAIVETDPKLGLEWNLRALDLAERSSDERAQRWRASLYNNIGWTHFEQKQYDKALDLFTRAVALRQQMNQPRELRIARYCVAKTLRHMNRLDDAIAINRELIEAGNKDGQPDGYVFEEMGECLLALGRAGEARPCFRRAHELLSQDAWLVENEPERLSRLKKLGTAPSP
jgi:tetratricopeptide (TPR) repeat protein